MSRFISFGLTQEGDAIFGDSATSFSRLKGAVCRARWTGEYRDSMFAVTPEHSEHVDGSAWEIAANFKDRWPSRSEFLAAHEVALAKPIKVLLRGFDATVETMESMKYLPGLVELRVHSSNKFTDPALLNLAHLMKLKALEISNCPITDVGIENIMSLSELKCLILVGADVTDVTLLNASVLTNLAELCITKARITDNSLTHISELPLVILDLAGATICDNGLSHLAKIKTLRQLDLSGTRITDKGLEQIIKLEQLEVLSIAGTGVTEEGIKRLAGLPKLRFVNAQDTQVTCTSIEKTMVSSSDDEFRAKQ
jgi:Leucine-rich repeat (LRR) protein